MFRINKNTKLDKKTLIIILYIIYKLNGILGKTHLQKLLFLLNIRAFKRFKKPIVDLQFDKYKYGPFSYQVDEYIDHLENKKLINSKELIYNKEKKYIRYYCSENLPNIKELLLDNIEPRETMVLDEVIESYGSVSLRDLLDIVYRLPLVKNAKYCQPLEVAEKIEDEEKSYYDNFEEFEKLLK